MISCSFNSFRIFGHYISARFQIIWRPNLWLVSCTALISFLEFIILQISLSFLLYCCHLLLILCLSSCHSPLSSPLPKREAPDLSAPAFPSFHPFILSFLHEICAASTLSSPWTMLSSTRSIRDSLHPFPPLRLKNFLTWDSAQPLLPCNGPKNNLSQSYKLTVVLSVFTNPDRYAPSILGSPILNSLFVATDMELPSSSVTVPATSEPIQSPQTIPTQTPQLFGSRKFELHDDPATSHSVEHIPGVLEGKALTIAVCAAAWNSG